MFEIFLFLIIFVVLAAILTGVIFLTGQTVHISLGISWYLAVISLIAFFPALLNFWAFFDRKSGKDLTKRTFALFRGFGMTIIGAMFLCLLSVNNFPKPFIYGGFILGAFLWWGLLPFEDRYESKKHRMATLPINPADAATEREKR